MDFVTSDGWDWRLILYAGTVVLKRTEDALWKMTPRVFVSLITVHSEVNSPDNIDNNKPNTTIDKIPMFG